MSFTEETEYVSMWAIYGKTSGIKLRIDFSKDKFKEAVRDNFFFDCQLSEKINSTNDVNNGIINATFSDVVYLVKATGELNHKSNPFPNIKGTDEIISKMAGIIKYSAWEFERESRLKVQLSFDNSWNDSSISKMPDYILLLVLMKN